jgi:DNA replication protein DnaC
MIGEPTIADAILDRIIHNAHRIDIKGESMRRKNPAPGLTQQENPEIITDEE